MHKSIHSVYFKWLNNRDSDSFPSVKLFELQAGENRFSCSTHVAKGNKSNVRSESADGNTPISEDGICGRLPASPPTKALTGI